jgi:hypothetical protein
MATTTPNYGWTVPTSTDLVKDGATAIETLGDAVDATVFANAGAAIAKTIVDAKGDIIAATAADTVDRLAVGSNDTVLTADSSTATGLKWAAPAAGGMTSIASGSLPTGTTTLTISSIPTTYNQLLLQIFNVKGVTNTNILRVRINNISTNTYGAGTSGRLTSAVLTAIQFDGTNNTFDAASAEIFAQCSFPNYATTTGVKMGNFLWGSTDDNIYTDGLWTQVTQNTTAITRIDVVSSNSNFNGGTYVLYGVK